MATIIIPNFNTEKVMAGLNTYTYTIQTAGLHTAKIQVDHHQASNLTCTITQTGSVSATLASGTVQPSGVTVTQSHSSIILYGLANCAVNDVINFTLTSSAANDQQLNTVKSTFRVNQGQV
jgi:hypothetical protein